MMSPSRKLMEDLKTLLIKHNAELSGYDGVSLCINECEVVSFEESITPKSIDIELKKEE